MRNHDGRLAITFLELPATVNGRLFGPPSRDVYSFYRLPSRCCDHLAAIAKRAGYPNTRVLTPALRKGAQLSRHDWQRLAESDIVGFSVITRTASTSYEAADLVRARNPKATILFGGPHVSALPEEALRHGDVVVMREGDHTLCDLLDRFSEFSDRPYLADVEGIAYRDGEQVVVTKQRRLLTQDELDALPFPVYSPRVVRKLTHQTICTSRGCPHGCEYCSVIQNFGRGYRHLSEDRTMELFRHNLAQTRAPIFFADDNFTASSRRVKSILTRCLVEGLRLPRWSCQSRVEAAFDDELLELMVRTNMNTIMVGFESINDATLALWRKASSFEKNRQAVERFHDKGIYIHGMFMLGSDVDTPETIEQTIAFAKEMNIDTAQFFALTPIPGPPLTRKLEAEGRVLTHDWHLYDAQHVVIQPQLMSPAELQEGIARAFRRFYSPREGIRKLFTKGPYRWHNCLIRFLGNRLVRRIIEETLPHRNDLDRLNDWLKNVDELLANFKDHVGELGDKLKSAHRELSEAIDRTRQDLSERTAGYLEAFEDRIGRLRESLPSLSERYHPFCRRLLEELRIRFRSEMEAVLVRS